MNGSPAVEFWYLALAEPIGLLLEVNDPQRAKQALYQARARVQDPALAELQVRSWSPSEAHLPQLVICHQRLQVARAAKKEEALS